MQSASDQGWSKSKIICTIWHENKHALWHNLVRSSRHFYPQVESGKVRSQYDRWNELRMWLAAVCYLLVVIKSVLYVYWLRKPHWNITLTLSSMGNSLPYWNPVQLLKECDILFNVLSCICLATILIVVLSFVQIQCESRFLKNSTLSLYLYFLISFSKMKCVSRCWQSQLVNGNLALKMISYVNI